MREHAHCEPHGHSPADAYSDAQSHRDAGANRHADPHTHRDAHSGGSPHDRCDVVGTAQGGSVSWTGTVATWELLISPGGIVAKPTNTSGEFGPLTAGTYTYESTDAGGNEVQHGQFKVAACPT